METEKIGKLALKLSLPMIMSMLSIAIYNLVDTAFVSGLGGDALLGISFAFPIQVIISSIGLGLGIGVSSLIGRKLGAKENEKVKLIISNGIIIGAVTSIVLAAILNDETLKIFFNHFTESQSVIKFGMDYIRIIAIFSINNVFQSILAKILEAHGKASLSMISQFTAIIVNLILDPILIFGINGRFSLGINGAAIATIVGQTVRTDN